MKLGLLGERVVFASVESTGKVARSFVGRAIQSVLNCGTTDESMDDLIEDCPPVGGRCALLFGEKATCCAVTLRRANGHFVPAEVVSIPGESRRRVLALTVTKKTGRRQVAF